MFYDNHTYEEVSSETFASTMTPNGVGYEGTEIRFALIEGEVVAVAYSGYFRINMQANDQDQAIEKLNERFEKVNV